MTEYQDLWNQQKEISGDRWKGDTAKRLLIQNDGAPIFPCTLYKWLSEFLSANGFEHFSLHSLRHTKLSLLIFEGVDIKTVQARSGHQKTATSLDTYAYFFDSGQSRAVKALEECLIDSAITATAWI